MKRTIFLFLFLCAPLLHAYDDINNDFQFWGYASLEKKVTPHWAGKLIASERWDDNATRPYYAYLQGDINWEPMSNLLIIPAFRQAWVKEDSGWKSDPGFLFSVIRKWHLFGFQVSDRSQFQYRNLSRTWVYRNRIQVNLPFSFLPYISDEFFWLKMNRYVQNRLEFGLLRGSLGPFEGEVAYILRFKESGDKWIKQNILKAAITINF